jgi:hypothetical protein
LSSAHLDIRVHNAYEVRDQIKALGYRWNDTGHYWQRAVMAVQAGSGDIVHRWPTPHRGRPRPPALQ